MVRYRNIIDVYLGFHNGILFAAKKNGYYKIYLERDLYPHKVCDVFFEGQFLHVTPLISNDISAERQAIYTLLEDSNGEGIVVELIEKKIILKGIQYRDYVDFYGRKNYNGIVDLEGSYLFFDNKQIKDFCIRNFLNQFIFGPYIYRDIDYFENGIIIDDQFVIDKDGGVTDLNDYIELDNAIYCSNDRTEYYIFRDYDGCLLHEFGNERVNWKGEKIVETNIDMDGTAFRLFYNIDANVLEEERIED